MSTNSFRIKDVANLISQKSDDASLPYIALDNIVSWDGTFIPSESTTDGNSNQFQAGDVLFGKLRPYLAKCYIPEYDGICSPELLVLRPTKKIHNRFLQYFLLTSTFIGFIRNQVAGVKMPRTNWNQIGNYPILLPCLDTQAAIVAYLDKECERIGREIELLERKADAYRRLRRSIINQTVTRGLNPNVPLKDSGIEWIEPIPSHWITTRFATAFTEHYISNKDVNHQNLLSLSYGNIIRKNIDSCDGLLPASFETYQIIEPGNIILRFTDLQNDHRSLRVGLVREEGIITSAYVCVECTKLLTPKFSFYLLHSYDIKKVFYKLGGGMRQTLNFKTAKNMGIVVPPISEQVAIAHYLDKRCATIDAIFSKIVAKIEKLKELKRSLINEVVTGQRAII